MSTSAKRKPLPEPEPVRSAEREALAEAIAARTIAREAVAEHRRKLTRAADAATGAVNRLELAKQSAEAAKTERTARVVAGDDAPPPAGARRNARDAIADAEEDATDMQARLVALQGQLPALAWAEQRASNAVIVHADIVLRTALDGAIAAFHDAADAYAKAEALVQWHREPSVTPDHRLHMGSVSVSFGEDHANTTLRQTALNAGDWAIFEAREAAKKREPWNHEPVLTAWVAARNALHDDPDAELPAIG